MGSITEAEKLAQIDAVISSVSSGQSHGILLVMVLIPLLMMLSAYILYRKHYILDEDEYDRIVEELGHKSAQ
jgi:Na+/melibiose symporter-like transporter